MDEAKSIADLLRSSSGPLGRLVANAARLDEATRALRAGLAPPLDQHVSVAGLGPTTLVVVTDSPAWASRLRYQSESILNHICAALATPSLTRVQILVRPPEPGPLSDRAHRARLSSGSARLLASVSRDLEAGPLRRRLQRLAERVEREEPRNPRKG